ncbi:MAG: fatty-acid--CoA ligase [Acidimicrobiia bacterium]
MKGETVEGTATLCEAFQATVAARPGDAVALRTLDSKVQITWGAYAQRVRAITGGLHAIGMRRGDTLALMLANRPEFNVVDTAAMHLGVTAFSVYNTLPVEQIAYQLENSEASVVVTEPQLVERVLVARTPAVRAIVLVEGEHSEATTLDTIESSGPGDFDFDAAWHAVQPDDVLTLIYTSGTTGNPKGVELTHANLLAQNRAIEAVLPTAPGDQALSYLPAAHLADRWTSHYWPSICRGATITTVPDLAQLSAAFVQVRPTMIITVPRVLEKLKAGLEAAGVTEPAALDPAAKKAALARIGFDRMEWPIAAGAPVAVDLLQFWADLDLPVLEAWGMTELGAFATLSPPGAIRIGTAGRPMPGFELRLLEDGEILARGPSVMKGYRNDPIRTAEALDPDGWVHTGDIGTIDDDGYVRIVDRKKEIIINSAGKNMSPANIEWRLKASSPLIGQAICIGDGRRYNVALLVLDPDTSGKWAAERGLDPSLASLAVNDDLLAAIASAVEEANQQLSRVEQIKRFEVLAVDWLPAGDELTPTSKLKRKPIQEKYADVIDRLYAH